jgi:pimeloyl-ACP methyl ester carboxylesterase
VTGGPTWEVTFGLLRAAGERQGVFVTAAGGPGTAGLSLADAYTAVFPEGITETYDVVFFDQRGVGASRPIQCPVASDVYYRDPSQAAQPAQADAAKDAARTYAAACLEESGVPESDLPYYSTVQAVEDLEAFREYLEVDALHLYGLSYGTQYAQAYAMSHPDRVAALYLDGPVDLTIDSASSYAEASRAFDDVLIGTLNGCAADPACLADHEGLTPLDAYDALAAELADAPVRVDVVLADGTIEPRALTLTDLQTVTAAYLYSPFDRMMLVRILASAVDGNYVPLIRALAVSLGLDVETDEVIPDPAWSDAMYYTVQCQDADYFATVGGPDARADAYLSFAEATGIDRLRLGAVYYADLPCVYWPIEARAEERPPIIDAPYPTFVLVGTADPITPVANAHRIASRLTDVYLILTEGGPHVTSGWGESCPDDIVRDHLVGGKLPEPTTICAGSLVDTYVPIGRDRAADYEDALALMTSMDDQIVYTGDYQYLLGDETLSVGCDFGGVMTYVPTDAGTELEFDGCAFVDGLAMTGSGAIDDETGGLVLDVLLADGELSYARDGDGRSTVTGTYRGEAVDLVG